MEKIVFFDAETNEEVLFYVLEQTMINGCNYILVTEDEEGDSEAYIMKETVVSETEESTYEMVEDSTELEALAKVFSEMMEDVDLV